MKRELKLPKLSEIVQKLEFNEPLTPLDRLVFIGTKGTKEALQQVYDQGYEDGLAAQKHTE
ncbi:hypothetical protein CASP1_00035 [Alcaligenes phage CASP1]|nr:hypothetical protein CASP1_00035 [Alcaligenes phage CASP1]